MSRSNTRENARTIQCHYYLKEALMVRGAVDCGWKLANIEQ